MDGHFTDVIPVAEVHAGLVFIDVGNGHKPIIVPVHAVRKFCEITILAINDWEEGEARRRVVEPLRKIDGGHR